MNTRWAVFGVASVLVSSLAGCGDDEACDCAGASGGAGATGGSGGAPGGTGGATGGSAGTGATGGSATGGTGGASGEAGAGGVEPAPTETRTYAGTDEIFTNPERGFHRNVDLVESTDYGWVAEDGYTLARSYVRLDDYREAPIPDTLLDDLSLGFDAAREAGIKIIPRFAYNFGFEDDAPLSRVLAHIAQITPVLQANADVIAVLHAGFIGAWGEWHASTNDLTSPENSRQIAEALLDALPASRMIQVRTPRAKEAMWGAPLTPAEAFDGSYKARTGHLNDCFLCNDTDAGTYPSSDLETYKNFVAQETLFTPMGGETCQLNEGNQRGDCATTLAEMERLHWSYINLDFFEPAIERWRTEGCFDTIQRRLGYRFELVEADVPSRVRPGGNFVLRVQLHNDGFASLYNERPVFVVLDDGANRYEVELESVDARRWAAGEDAEWSAHLELPGNVPEGEYALAVWLPDEAAALRANPAFNVRFANDAGWDPDQGYHVLGQVQIDDDAAGSSNPDAAAFTMLDEP
jgi:hypothetical protein